MSLLPTAHRSRKSASAEVGERRTTFVIDSEGVVADVLRKVKPAEHDERVLAALVQTV